MAKHIFRCKKCREYTMKEICSCSGKAISTRPAKYSPEDKYGKYRRETKRENLKKQGML